jgi:putative membrane protein
VPLLVGGLLVWALWQPDERLDRIQAAVVNEDMPVEVDGQLVPLGRQLAAALVTAPGGAAPASEGEPEDASGGDSTANFTWVVTNADDAASGLADGRFATVVTIPSGFSAAATSVGTDPANARRATLDIATSERSRPVDPAVAQLVTTAVRVLSTQLTSTYLENVFVGFDTLRGHLQDASDGAAQLADGTTQLGTGATELSTGAAALATGADQLASGVSSLATGAQSLSSGTGRLSSGASTLADGLDQLAGEAASAAVTAQAGVPQAQQFAAGLEQLAGGITAPGGLADGTAQLATGTSGLQAGLAGFGQQAQALAAACATPDPAACAALAAFVDPAGTPNAPGPTTAPNLAYLSATTDGLASGAAGLDAAVNHGTPSLAASATSLAAAGRQLGDGVAASAGGLGTLAGALELSASGARTLADGAKQTAAGASSLASGISSLATGAEQSAAGASSLSSGAGELATGAGELGAGATELADGLGTAAGEVPGYSADEAGRLAEVVAEPVAANVPGLFGAAGIPFVLVVALWLGAMATFLVLSPTTPRVVGSTRSSLRLALTAAVPGAAVGVVQGLVLTAAMSRALDLTPGGWVAFGAVACLAGIAFAAVNQGLVAVGRGIGRFVALVVAVVGLATAVVSTVPGLLDAVDAALPLAPARDAMLGVLTSTGAGGAVALLVVWTAVGLGLTTAAIARRRVVPAGQLARWARAA